MRPIGVLLVLVACGGGSGNTIADAPQPLDTPDPSTAGPVRVTITNGGAPRAGVRVHFQNADSSVVASTTTDAGGVASAMMVAGGFVTAVDPFESSDAGNGITLSDVRTIAGVKPGDNLVLKASRATTSVNFTLTLGNAPNGKRYFLFSPCSAFLDVTGPNGAPNPGGLFNLAGCGAVTDLLIQVLDANNKVISFLYKPDVTIVNNGTLDFTADTYTAAPTTTWTFESIPMRYPAMHFESMMLATHGMVMFSVINDGATIGTATLTDKTAIVPNAAQVDVASLLGPALATQRVVTWGPAKANSTVSLADLLVPDYTSEPVFDIPKHTLSWTVDTTNAALPPDFAITTLKFDRQAASLFWSWTIAAPNAAPTLAFPVLPGEDARLNPVTAGDGTFVFGLETGRAPGGYDAIRANAATHESPFDYATGPTGQIVFGALTRANQ